MTAPRPTARRSPWRSWPPWPARSRSRAAAAARPRPTSGPAAAAMPDRGRTLPRCRPSGPAAAPPRSRLPNHSRHRGPTPRPTHRPRSAPSSTPARSPSRSKGGDQADRAIAASPPGSAASSAATSAPSTATGPRRRSSCGCRRTGSTSTLDALAKLGTEETRSVQTDGRHRAARRPRRPAGHPAGQRRPGTGPAGPGQTIGEIVSLESELTRREAELASLEQRGQARRAGRAVHHHREPARPGRGAEATRGARDRLHRRAEGGLGGLPGLGARSC